MNRLYLHEANNNAALKLEREIKAKYLYMLRAVRGLMDRQEIAGFSIIRESLESVFKKVVMVCTE
jgi:acetylglutamate kinase